MARLRIGGLAADTPPNPGRLRIGGISADGAAPVGGGRLRVGGISADGALAILLQPLANQTGVEPLSTITLTATPVAGSAIPDSYTWWQEPTGAPNVAFSGAGATRTFPAPAAPAGCTVRIGVRAVKDGIPSPDQYVTITVLPHGRWYVSGSQWAPVKLVSLA